MKFRIYIAGWYFDEYKKFYEDIISLKDHVIIGSHRRIPKYISSTFKSKEYENIGGGIGLYEQLRLDAHFSEIGDQDFVIFMHDDTTILRLDFPGKLYEILETKKCAGNSIELPLCHGFDGISSCEEYARGSWFHKAKEIPEFKWRVIDGRCFAIRPKTLLEVNGFEDMYWGTEPRMTNISLRLFSAKLSVFYGTESVGYLSDKWLESDYLIEDRGDNPKRRKRSVIRRVIDFLQSVNSLAL